MSPTTNSAGPWRLDGAGHAITASRMHSLKKWLFNIFAAASLVLGVATCAVWLRSYFAYDTWHFWSVRNGERPPLRTQIWIQCGEGSLSWFRCRQTAGNGGRFGTDVELLLAHDWQFLGDGYKTTSPVQPKVYFRMP